MSDKLLKKIELLENWLEYVILFGTTIYTLYLAASVGYLSLKWLLLPLRILVPALFIYATFKAFRYFKEQDKKLLNYNDVVEIQKRKEDKPLEVNKTEIDEYGFDEQLDDSEDLYSVAARSDNR